MKPPLLIVDIDGTVCDSIKVIDEVSCQSGVHVNDWNDDQTRLFLDKVIQCPIIPGAEILPFFISRGICDVIFLTGRSEKVNKSKHIGRNITMNWLHKKLGMPKTVQLYMRPFNTGGIKLPDFIKFDVFKKQILPKRKRRNFIFLDDDVKVLYKYGEYGLTLKAPECWAALDHIISEAGRERKCGKWS